jgi:hypothetical protein
MQKHQIEDVVRDMFVKNNYDLNDFQGRLAGIQAASIFYGNSPGSVSSVKGQVELEAL